MVDSHRARIFGRAAETYDAARPEYPPEVIDLILRGEPRSAVDVGCGTGKAARKVRQRGIEVLGVEPDPRMAAVARGHGIDVVEVTFEEWPATPHDCVFSAQAWHWVDPVGGASKAAAVLPAGGRWTAVWNGEDDPRLTAALVDTYARWAPQLVEERQMFTAREAGLVDETRRGIEAAAAFEPMERDEVAWREELTVGKLVDRLSTTSAHQLLPADVAHRLHDELGEALGGRDATVDLDYTTLVLSAVRR